jgi:NAD(P) transhydrogenase subunit alpha
VICTALIPGKKAPIIIKDNMIKNMQPGSVIYDLAAIQGGNTANTEVDQIIDVNGVKIMGEKNILNKLPVSSSNLYAKNLFNFVLNLYDKDNKKININLEDEIINKTLVK